MVANPRILIVDDDDDICANLRDILDDAGYHADTASDGKAALQLLQSNSYDVALLDFMMPGMDGAQLYREIRRLRPEIVAILITAYSGSHGSNEAIDAGVWKVLRKPVDLGEVISLVEEAVAEPLILLVDDDTELCDSLWQVLREHHFRVSVAHGEREGIDKATHLPFQVALVDLRLEGGDGLKVIEKTRIANPGARTILMTGHHDAAEAERVANCKPDVICFKPFEIGRLIDLIKK